MASEQIVSAKIKDSLTLDFDALPIQGFEEGRLHVQNNFNHDFAKMPRRQQIHVEQLLTKKNWTRDETEQIRNLFSKYEIQAHEKDNEEVMENQPVDYTTLDQDTKKRIAIDRVNAIKAVENKEAMIKDALDKETQRAEKIASLITEFSTNEKGETLANVHTCEGFQEVYDYTGTILARNRLERKKEQVSSGYDAKTHLFQKVYYGKGLLLDDERKLRLSFNSAKSAYEQQIVGAKAAMFLAYWPLTYRLSLSVKPATLVLWTGAYCYSYTLCKKMAGMRLQQVINDAATEFAPKYGISQSDGL